MLAKLFAALVFITISSSNLAQEPKVPQVPSHYIFDQVHCLAEAVYHESRGEPLDGQAAVARVVMNRTKFPKQFGSTICEVVYQPGQFSWTAHEKLNFKRHENDPEFQVIEERCWIWMLADDFDLRYTPHAVTNATFFSRTRPRAHGLKLSGAIGHHRFYYNKNLLVDARKIK